MKKTKLKTSSLAASLKLCYIFAIRAKNKLAKKNIKVEFFSTKRVAHQELDPIEGIVTGGCRRYFNNDIVAFF